MTSPLPAYTVRITVDSFQDKNYRAVYEFPEGSSVTHLKAEIEATENIPVGHQRLVYNDLELEDNESLDSLIAENPTNTIIFLHQPRIFLHLEQRDTTESKSQVKTINLSPDLTEPIGTSLTWITDCEGKAIDLSSAKLSILGSSKRSSISISDINQSFSSYGICNGDTIDIILDKPWINPNQSTTSLEDLSPPKKKRRLSGSSDTIQSPSSSPFRDDLGAKKRRGLSDSPRKSPRKLVRAKYSWDGEIMTPAIKGLSLTRDALFEISQSERRSAQPGWLYGSQASRYADWRPSFSFKEGYFPENFVSVVAEKGASSEELSETADSTLEIPPLPPFRFPPASGMEFDMPIGDRGHSFLNLTADYDCKSCPTDPTHVTFKLKCSTHGSRRIASVSMFIKIPENAILDVQVCKIEAHLKEIEAGQEIIESRTKAKFFNGANAGAFGATAGVQAGALKKHSIDHTETGLKVFRRMAEAEVSKKDAVFWNLKAPMTKLDYEGLNGMESITLVLKKKPAKFIYKCLVTHVKDGFTKTTERTFKK